MSIDREVDQAVEAFAKPAVPSVADLVLSQLEGREPRSVENMAEDLSTRHGFYESDVRAAILGLIRRNRVELTEDLLVKLPDKPAVHSIDVMSPEEWEEQRRSFAYGNVALSNPAVTREVIDRAADALAAAPDKIRVFTIRVTVLDKDAERIGKELEEFLAIQCNTTPGYIGSFSHKDEEV